MKVIEADRGNIDGRVGTSTSGNDDWLLRRCRLHRLRRLQHRLERILAYSKVRHVHSCTPRLLVAAVLSGWQARRARRQVANASWRTNPRIQQSIGKLNIGYGRLGAALHKPSKYVVPPVRDTGA